MYKEAIISIIIVILIFSIDYITQNYTEKNVDLIQNEFQTLRTNLEKGDLNNAEMEIKKIENNWNSIKNKLACYIEHNELNKIEVSFTLCKSLAKSGKYELAISKLDETIFILEHMNERYVLSLENIF